MEFRTRESRFLRREGLLFAMAAAASLAFQFHGLFYLDGRSAPPEFRIEPFFFVTGLSYLFLRFVVLAIELRPARVPADHIRCPGCGRWIDNPSRRPEAIPQLFAVTPTRKGVVSAGALRRAVDSAQFGLHVHASTPIPEGPAVRPKAETVTGQELALDDPNFLERERHGPPSPLAERRMRR